MINTLKKNSQTPLLLGLSNTRNWFENFVKTTNLQGSMLETKYFADGELMVNIPFSVRNRDVFLCQSTSKPVNNSVMELLIAIDALKRASVKSISLIMPYFGYARQDRKARGREPITAKLLGNILTFLGVKRILTFDLHTPQIQGFFEIPLDHLSLLPQMLFQLIKQQLSSNKNISLKEFVFVMPDEGCYKRIQKLNHDLKLPIAIIYKSRPKINQTEITHLLGDINNKNLIILDDMIDTGNTLLNSLNFLNNHQAKEIYIIVTHGVFSQNCLDNFMKAYQAKKFKKLIVSNSIAIENAAKYPFLSVYDISLDLINLIDILLKGKSISQYGMEQLQKLSKYK